MNIVILCSSRHGTAAHHLPHLAESGACTISAVIYNRGESVNRGKYLRRKLKKTLRIGPLGALNGIRMRRWYGEEVRKRLAIGELDELCRDLGVPYFETPAINCPETRNLFEQAEADLGLSLGNPFISEEVFNIPEYGMVNVHHELLPEYQGAQSVIWQLYHGSDRSGYTIHKVDRKIDGGEILCREAVPIRFEDTLADTVSSTSAELLRRSAEGLVRMLEDFDRFWSEARPQDGKGATYTTPSIWQFLRIWYNWRQLREEGGE